jgi:hypothetical protein
VGEDGVIEEPSSVPIGDAGTSNEVARRGDRDVGDNRKSSAGMRVFATFWVLSEIIAMEGILAGASSVALGVLPGMNDEKVQLGSFYNPNIYM